MKFKKASLVVLMLIASLIVGAVPACAAVHELYVHTYDENNAALSADSIILLDSQNNPVGQPVTNTDLAHWTINGEGIYTINAQETGYPATTETVGIGLADTYNVYLNLHGSGSNGTNGTTVTSGDVYVKDVNVNPDDRVKPGEEVTFEIKLRSNISAEYVTLEAKIKGIDDNDDTKEEIDIGNLDAGDKVTEEISMNIPYTAKEGKYDVAIKVTWETDAGENYSTWAKADLIEVQREKHDVIITNMQLSAPVLEAGSDAEIGVALANIGENNENVKIEVKSDELGVDDFSSQFELKKGKETVQYIPFMLPKDAKEGKYFIYTTVHYNNGNSETFNYVILEVAEQVAQKTAAAAVSLSPVTVSTSTNAGPASGENTGLVGAIIVAVIALAAIGVAVGKQYLPESMQKNIVKITKRK